jgi:hypothetical protein
MHQEGKERLNREYGVMEDLNRKKHFYEFAVQHESALADHAVQATLRGFELGFRERQVR